jgi:hypothetical protein
MLGELIQACNPGQGTDHDPKYALIRDIKSLIPIDFSSGMTSPQRDGKIKLYVREIIEREIR